MPEIAKPPLLRPGWIVYALFALYPVFWLLGLSAFIWALFAPILATWWLTHRNLIRPPAISLYIAYVVWAGFTIVRLDRFSRLFTFGERYGAYLTALGLAYYVYNERRVSRSTFINWVAVLWVVSIIGGYLGLIFSHVRLGMTPTSLLLPESWTADDFVNNLVRPRFAQVHSVGDNLIPRPAAPYAYTNAWGSAVGLLTPFYLAATLYSSDRRRQRLGVVGLVLALPPMILSVNRGLWLSIGVIVVVVAVRSFFAGRTAPLKLLALAVVGVTATLAFTPLGDVVRDRLSESSASARAGIYREAWEGAKASPLLGWGGPRPSSNPFSPAVGTHGHLWFAMFSHGLVGAALYVAWLVGAMYKMSFRRDPVSMMMASVVYVGAIQALFYSALSVPISIMTIAIGLHFRPVEEGRRGMQIQPVPRLASMAR